MAAERTGKRGEPADEDLSAIAQAIGHLWRAIMSGMEQPEHVAPLQPQQFWVLGVLSRGPKRMSELAEATRTSSANVTGLVDRLVDRGLVERRRPEADRRVVEVSLTGEGRALMSAGQATFRRRVQEVLSPLTPAELLELERLIRKALG